MAKINGNEISPGTLIDFQGALWIAVKTVKVKPGKGGAYNQVELKNVTQGTKLNQRFRSDETVEEVYLEKKDFQFLYASGDMLTFMDMETYDQIELAAEFVGDQAQFLQDGMKTLVQMYEDKPIGIKLPVQVTLTVSRSGLEGRHRRALLQECGAGKRHEDSGAALHRRRREDHRRHRRRFLRAG